MALNKALARKWSKALRSGKYKQGYGQLLQDGKYCCLGVLCDISGLTEWEESEASPGLFLAKPRTGKGKPSYGSLPVALAKALDLGRGPVVVDDEAVGIDSIENILIELNDDHGYTFEEIADAIDLLVYSAE